ncbi:hypothetical protein ACS5PN_06670 [Roseateles sp. NT4]|uniref:hypothetical protein n=1 Tax=Roseateles sp. NT4 TaxID=3453715 RepID=UPI003EEC198A
MRALLVLALPLLVSASHAAEPAASAPRLVQKVVRSTDTRRDWELAYTLSDHKLSLRCVKSMTGRCGVRLIDAPHADAPEADLHVEWIGVPAGSTVDRTIQGKAYALCFRPDVGDDKACEPLSALTAF